MSNANLEAMLKAVYSRLTEFNSAVMQALNTTGNSATEIDYYDALQRLVHDDMTFVESIQDANALGYLTGVADRLARIQVDVPAHTQVEYKPVMRQIRLEGYNTPLNYLIHALSNVNPVSSFYAAMKNISCRLDAPESLRIVVAIGMRADTAVVKLSNADGTEATIDDFTDLLAYVTLEQEGFIYLGALYQIRTAGDFMEAYLHNTHTIGKEYTQQEEAYRALHSKMKPILDDKKLRDAYHNIEILLDNTARNQSMILHLNKAMSEQRMELEAEMIRLEHDVKRKASDDLIVGIVAVILLFFIILSFLH